MFPNRLVVANLRADSSRTLANVLVIALEVAVILILAGIKSGMVFHTDTQQRQMGELFVIMLGVVFCVCFSFSLIGKHAAVHERTDEIGLLKALGASSTYVLNLLFQETLLVVIPGTIIGVVIAYASKWLITEILGDFITQEIVYEWWPIAGVVAFTGDLLGGLMPAWNALRRDWIEESISGEG